MVDLEKIKKTIQSLSKKAESLLSLKLNAKDYASEQALKDALECFHTEAKACMRRVKKMMEQYAIDAHDLWQNASVEDAPRMGGIRFKAPERIFSTREKYYFTALCDAISTICMVRIVILHGTEGMICGEEKNAQQALSMFNSLCETALLFFDTLKKHRTRIYGKEESKKLKKFEYMDGFAFAVWEGAQKEKNEDSTAPDKKLLGGDVEDNTQALAVVKRDIAVIAEAVVKHIFPDEEIQQDAKAEYQPVSDSFKQGRHDGQTREKVRV